MPKTKSILLTDKKNILRDTTVLNRFPIGSHHKMMSGTGSKFEKRNHKNFVKMPQERMKLPWKPGTIRETYGEIVTSFMYIMENGTVNTEKFNEGIVIGIKQAEKRDCLTNTKN